MTRYVAIPVKPIPRADAEDWPEPHCSIVVLETDPAPVPTGLLDAAGVPLYRVADRIPMGFRSCRER